MGKVTEIKKANGEIMRIIDGEYVIGASSGCFSSPKPCRKIINGEYVINKCFDCITLESLDCFINITTREQFKEVIDFGLWPRTQNEVTLIETFDFFDRITLHENRILGANSVLFAKLNCFITLKENKEVDFCDIDEPGITYPYHNLIKNNTVLTFGRFDWYEPLKTDGSAIISNNSTMHEIKPSNYLAIFTTKPILPGDYYIYINYNGVIDIALKNSTNETLYILDLGS